MADLTTKGREKMPASKFGLVEDGEKKYPLNDKVHARNAKARASQQYNKGNLSAAEKAKIDRKADKMLDGKDNRQDDADDQDTNQTSGKKKYPMPDSRFKK